MLISCPNGSKKLKFIPDSKYDNFQLGRLKGRLEKTGISCELKMDLNTETGCQDLTGLSISKDDLMILLIG